MKLHFDISTSTLNTLYKKIYDYTNSNWHNYSVLELAKFLELDEYVNELKEIIKEHEKLGFMDDILMKRRDEIRLICINIFNLYYGIEAAKKINSAY